ncbi:MAG: AlpA family transcriptional regulator [Rhodocyclales bacterium]|nr:AlpA family transcriptional regulator [Rhodocyclales bacterium]
MGVKKYLRASQIVELTGLSRATIYAMEKKGDFPQKIPLGARAVAWVESEIEAWLEERKSAIKTGREAKPGRPPTAGKPRVSEDASSVNVAPQIVGKNLSSKLRAALARTNFSATRNEDWGQSDPTPSEKQMATVRAKLAASAAQSKGTGNRPRSASAISGATTVSGKGIRGEVNVLAGSTPKKKTR